MTEQDVTIRFVGVDSGLSASATQAASGLNQLSQAQQGLGTATAASSKEITSLAQALGTNYKEAQRFAAELEKGTGAATGLSSALKGSAAATGLTAAKTGEAIAQLRQLNKVGADNATKFQILNKELGVTQSQFDKLNKAAASTKEGLATIATAAGVLGAGIGAAFGSGVQSFADFDAAIRTFGAVTESTGTPALAALRTEIERLGVETQKTPQEIANLAIELGKAGFSADQVKDALGGVVLGSQATGENLTRLGEVIGSTINQFGLVASDSSKISDLIVATSNASAAGVDGLGEALSEVGSQSKASNQDLKTTLFVLGQLANAGTQGGKAGTGLAEALRRIKIASANAETTMAALSSGGADKAAKAFKVLNAQVRTASGDLIPFPEIIDKLKVSLATLAKPEQELLLDNLFGVQGGQVVQTLLGGNVDQINNLSTALDNANGIADRTSQTLTQGLSASFTTLQSSASVALQRFGEFAAGGLEPLVRGAAAVVNGFLKLPAPIQGGLIAVVAFTGVLSAAIAAITAYNLANGSYIISTTLATAAQLLANTQSTIATGITIAQAAAIEGLAFARNVDLIAIGKQSAAQLLLTLRSQATAIATAANAAAQVVYALATGRGTEAAIAQATALKVQAAGFIGTAASAGVFAAAIASIALAANSFNESLKAANALQQGVTSVDEALRKLDVATQGAAKSQSALADATKTEASRNLEKLKNDLNGFAQATDAVITFLNEAAERFSLQPFFRELAKLENIPEPLRKLFEFIGSFELSTIAETSATQVGAAFDDLVAKTTDTLVKFQALDLGKATKEQLKAQTEAIAASISALEAAAPTQEDDINRRNLQVEALKKAQAELENYGKATQTASAITQKAAEMDTDAIKKAADARADALKAAREAEQTGQERAFQDEGTKRDRAFQSEKQADEQAFQDQSQAAERSFTAQQQQIEQTFKDKQKADEAAFNAAQQSAEESFKKNQQTSEQAFQAKQQAAQKTFADRQQQEQDSFNAAQLAREDAFKNAQRVKDTAAQNQFEARQKAIDRFLQIEQADPGDRAALQEQFKQEDANAQRRAQLEAGLRADEAAFEKQKQAEEETFRQNAQAQEDKFKAFQQQQDEAFKLAQQQADEAFKLAQQEQERVFKAEQQQADADFNAQQQEADRAFTLEQQTAEQAFKDAEREKERAFKAEQAAEDLAFKDAERERDRAFKDDQRAKDLATAEQVKIIIESARTPTIEGRFRGGSMEAGTPYWVGEGRGGRILPSSEIIVPNTGSYAVAANRARTWLTQSAQPDRALLAEIRALRNTIESREPTIPITANFPTEGVPFDRYLKAQRAVIRAMI